jgi:chaperonin cofactor prefoldin
MVVPMEENEIEITSLKERVGFLEKTQERLQSKFDKLQALLLTILGGLAVNLLVLLLK